MFDTFKWPLRDPSQRIYGILTYRRDITERYTTEQEQRALEKQLQQAQKMELIGHLTGGIAHDFNNILAAMFGYGELVQMSPVVQQHPQLRVYVEQILQAGIRAKELVSQLLTFSRRREPASEAIAVAPIVAEVAKLLRSTLPATIAIRIGVAQDLPDVLIGPVHLHQVMMNLAVNARDAMGGNGSLDIRVGAVGLAGRRVCDSCHQDFHGDFLVIAVRDSGIGIAAENLPKIFDPFFTTKEVGKGSGLGLSVLHGIVHSANGHIEVETAPGAGSEFRIYLPAQPQASRPPTGDVQHDRRDACVRGRVMVVDDEPSIVGFTTALLEQLGCEATGFSNALAALECFENAPDDIDMVILDQTMPDISGASLAAAMLARRPELPVILCTGYSNAIDDETIRRLGIRRFLMKPVPAKVLADVVAEYLAGIRETA